MTRPLKIGFLSAWNPYERTNFSGTIFYMRRALEARADIEELRVLGGHHRPLPYLAERVARRIIPSWSKRQRPDITRDKIDDTGLDAIFAPLSSGHVGQFGASLSAPCLMITDATPGFIRHFYDRDVPAQADRDEAAGLNAARLVVYSSRFVADLARTEFQGIDPDRLRVAPFGLNLDDLPTSATAKAPLDPVRLLFVGKNWQTKGGDIAVATLDNLRANGVDARLTMIGGKGPSVATHPHVEHLGYIDKGNPAGMARFKTALEQAHIFVLPTRADCTPMVVAEANAYGCPVLITETGGIPSLMSEGRNGQMLPMAAGPQDWADAVRTLIADRAAYDRLSKASYEHCMQHLTWEAWADKMMLFTRDILAVDAVSQA